MSRLQLLTLHDVAGELGCSVTTVKRRVSTGALPVFVDGNLVRVRDVDLRRYIAERVVRRAGPAATQPHGVLLAPGERLTDRGG